MTQIRQEDRPRLLRRARHLRHPALAHRDLPLRGRGLLRRPRAGRGADPGPREGPAHRRRRASTSSTCAKSSSATSSSRCCAPTPSTRARYLLGTSIARPLIAKAQVEVARPEGRGRGEPRRHRQGQRPGALRADLRGARRPTSTVIAPWREWDLDSRTALMDFARRHDIPVPVTAERPYSTDRNLFHISFEGGILEDPWAEPPPKMFLLTNSPEAAPDVPVYVEIEFEAGNPVAVDGRRLGAGGAARGGQPARRRARHRPRGPRREPLRGHEVARGLRDAGRDHPARGAPRARVASRSTARCCTCATRWCRATPR